MFVDEYISNDYTINNTFIELLSDMITQSGSESRIHMSYVQQYTSILVRFYSKLFPRAKMSDNKQKHIVLASLIHDVGKISMPDVLLARKGRMSVSELNLYKRHTIKGGQIVRSFSSGRDKDFERICYNVCLYHHEKYDGSGYPYGYREDKIPIEAQIVGLADIYDTLIHSDMSEDIGKSRAFHMIINNECGVISPKLIKCFESARKEMEAIIA